MDQESENRRDAAEEKLRRMAESTPFPTLEDVKTSKPGDIIPLSVPRTTLPEAQYRALVEQIPAVTFMASFEHGLREVYVSPQIKSLLGYTQEEWLESPRLWLERIHPDDVERWHADFAPLVFGGEPFRGEYRFVARDGKIVWVLGDARIVRDDAGRPLFVQGVGFDITELKRSQESLEKTQKDLQEIVSTIRETFWVLSPSLDRILYASPAFEAIWGVAAESLGSGPASLLEAIHPADRESVLQAFERMKEAEVEIEHRIAAHQGAVRWVRSRTFPVRNERREVVRVIAVSEDATRRKELEEQVQQAQRQHVARLVSKVKNEFAPDRLVGSSQAMERVRAGIRKLAPGEATVLITGESGTGKKIVAEALHYGSPRAQGPFFDVNCAAFSETLLHSELFGHEKGSFTGAHKQRLGHFEQAHGGTLFLDEIGDMPLNVQATILKVLEERSFRRLGGDEKITVDVRVICATNRDLEEAVKKGTFRLDLYYRIKGRVIELPPLRERPADIEELAQHFLDLADRAGLSISPVAMDLLKSHPWPGNVRELENALDQAVDFCEGDTILPDDLPKELARRGLRPAATAEKARIIEGFESCERTLMAALDGGLGLDQAVEQVERSLIVSALEKHNWVKTSAAKSLLLNERRLTYKMNDLGIAKPTA